ncbi:DNA-binding protein REB1 NDAI_0A06300 [Naumovozyma dairenensis CBS 421]|uniref:DNA-binding protein REB1 n=1 Tax=Naumovozyma dairenensis (strain ATCC 10597 / BCRC 20456 / CBS 421 / NBRC 0211 / NRRL Y-12639) TaxID=1071378 RepID=G0W4P6_NAUDC|nr:hypothetical protein NDAI_0A06300 [Naumovozyma dairenensis CBS 421]CCD22784.1 hypothetical protein NDAI_0A06300 [Naumovozyma dairenensis CBS 421]
MINKEKERISSSPARSPNENQNSESVEEAVLKYVGLQQQLLQYEQDKHQREPEDEQDQEQTNTNDNTRATTLSTTTNAAAASDDDDGKLHASENQNDRIESLASLPDHGNESWQNDTDVTMAAVANAFEKNRKRFHALQDSDYTTTHDENTTTSVQKKATTTRKKIKLEKQTTKNHEIQQQNDMNIVANTATSTVMVDPALATLDHNHDEERRRNYELVNKAILDTDTISQNADFQQYLNTEKISKQDDENHSNNHRRRRQIDLGVNFELPDVLDSKGSNHEQTSSADKDDKKTFQNEAEEEPDQTDKRSSSATRAHMTDRMVEEHNIERLTSTLPDIPSPSQFQLEIALQQQQQQRQHPHQQHIHRPYHSIEDEQTLKLLDEAVKKASSLIDVTTRSSKTKSFNKLEDVALETFVAAYEQIEGITRNQVCQRIWSNDRPRDNFWNNIYKVLPYRSNSSIYKHMRRKYHIFNQRGKWTEEEERQLAELCKDKEGQWSEIGKILNRMPEDCRDRWRNYVKCGSKRASNKWSEEEESLLKKIITDMLLEAELKRTQELNSNENENENENEQTSQQQLSGIDHKEAADEREQDEHEARNDIVDNAQVDTELQQQDQDEHQQEPNYQNGEEAGIYNVGNQDNNGATDILKNKMNNDELSALDLLETPAETNSATLPQSNKIKEIKKFPGLNFKDVINWTVISERMGGTRSRIQCRYKWNKLVRRDAINNLQHITNEEKRWLFGKILDLGFTEESQINWDELSNLKPGIKWSGLELKLCYERSKKYVRDGKTKNVGDLCKELIVSRELSDSI